MAHRPTHRRSLPAPERNPTSHPLDPTLKKSPKPTITTHPTTRSSDPLMASKKPFFITNRFSRLNLNHKTQKPTNTQHSRDIHLQAKALTVSADADSSLFSLIKSNPLLAREKAKESLKESVRKASKDLGRTKQQQQQQQHHHQRSVLDSKKLALTVKERQLKKLDEGHDDNDMKKASASLGRRRSLGGSQVELGDILANCGVKIVSVDMPPFMQIHAVDCARKTHDSLEKFTSKALALTLKKVMLIIYLKKWFIISNYLHRKYIPFATTCLWCYFLFIP